MLGKCLTSLIEQTEKDLQIILVDDGSTDQSLSIAMGYAAKDNRIEVLRQAHSGQSAARNNGLRKAKGEYISFVDADDYIDTDLLRKAAEVIKDADVVQYGFSKVDTSGKILYRKKAKSFYSFTSMCMRLIRRSFIESNELRFVEGQVYEDVIFSWDMWQANPKYVLLPDTGYFYTLNPQSTTSRQHNTHNLFIQLKQHKHSKTLKANIIYLFTVFKLKLHFFFDR